MSATNRGAKRQPLDLYETPAWCVHRLLDAWQPAHAAGTWLEPAAGSGAIVDAVDAWLRGRGAVPPYWCCIDKNANGLVEVVRDRRDCYCGDYVRFALPPPVRSRRFDVCITNPPYRDADRFVRQALSQCVEVVMLLRLNWLAGAQRSRWLREHEPRAVYVLPNRPDFTGGGGDATDYAWIAWGPGPRLGVQVLAETPRAERQAGA